MSTQIGQAMGDLKLPYPCHGTVLLDVRHCGEILARLRGRTQALGFDRFKTRAVQDVSIDLVSRSLRICPHKKCWQYRNYIVILTGEFKQKPTNRAKRQKRQRRDISWARRQDCTGSSYHLCRSIAALKRRSQTSRYHSLKCYVDDYTSRFMDPDPSQWHFDL